VDIPPRPRGSVLRTRRTGVLPPEDRGTVPHDDEVLARLMLVLLGSRGVVEIELTWQGEAKLAACQVLPQ
jgi:hypothetical protein